MFLSIQYSLIIGKIGTKYEFLMKHAKILILKFGLRIHSDLKRMTTSH